MDVIKKSIQEISEATNDEEILKMNLAKPHVKRYITQFKMPFPHAL